MIMNMKKVRMYFTMVVNALLRRKFRMFIALLAVAIGATIISGMITVYKEVPEQMGREFRAYGANLLLIPAEGNTILSENSITPVYSLLDSHEVVGKAPFLYERLKINEVRLEVNSKILLEEPKHYPTMMMEAIKECCDNLGNINKAWLLEMLTEKDKSWLLILDFEGDRNYIFSKISQAARNYLGNMYLDMLPYEDDFAKNAVVNHKTFYNKKI